MIGFDAFRKRITDLLSRIKRGIMDQRDERRGKIFLDDKSLSFFFSTNSVDTGLIESLQRGAFR